MATDKTLQTKHNTITDEAVFKVAKEVAIKFIEVGRLSPEGFPAGFATIYNSIKNTVQKDPSEDD